MLIRAFSLFIIFLSMPSQAALISMNWRSLGDNLITFDTSTQLQWLDLTETLGLSYNETLDTSYVKEYGFRFATLDELLDLYTSLGVQMDLLTSQSTGGQYYSSSSSVANAGPVLELIDLLGCTVFCDIGAAAGQGWLDLGVESKTSYSFFQLGSYSGEVAGSVSISNLEGTHDKDLPEINYARTQTGSFLVRSVAVPEPTTAFLLLAGLIPLLKRKLF